MFLFIVCLYNTQTQVEEGGKDTKNIKKPKQADENTKIGLTVFYLRGNLRIQKN